MRHEMNRIQNKDHNRGSYINIKIPLSCLLKMIKSIYLKMDIVGYYIFRNPLVKHKKQFCQI